MNFIKALSYSFLYFCILSTHKTYAQNTGPKSYKLIVKLERAPFDSLFLHDYTEGRDILITGKKTQAFTWEINIPDTIIRNSENIELLGSPYDVKSNLLQSIRFITKRAGKKIIVANVGVEDESTYIYATYLDTVHFSPENVMMKTGNNHSIIIGNLTCADFNLIIKDADADIAIRSEDPFFSWFMDLNDEAISYDNHLASYIEISKQHPDSRFLITYQANNLTRYHSKEDVKKVYENFSGKHKNTIWAKQIERFLYEKKFPNTSLPTCDKKTYENIVQDVSKYNLIIFTASWCAPCREEIPLLKKIHNDLGKNLILTYISIDNAQSVAAFQKLIREQNIPWRSLLAFQDVKAIKQKYFIEGIPHTILIYPNQDMEVMEVRKAEDLSKLYSIVGSPGKQKN
ncbi:TlpA family protein disulfide reductase [Mucilaginibacter paludis]|uniref:Thioredoxin domain-containing protein n=1 Tax=Mucilaginibacter paludis DSM 18603 TaxID=714943 RepID=H1Y8W4_9SPHI|nr:thioredoxin family protein [Mucilaginibacter paludis]EHQ28730.1 hypothetical protein Mucpa_4643 [Mucilaginibacter paludis DSM 18603]